MGALLPSPRLAAWGTPCAGLSKGPGTGLTMEPQPVEGHLRLTCPATYLLNEAIGVTRGIFTRSGVL